ncbi:hypothetical protein RvY_10758 [Ramazzottius varieornatus]|uniref:Uncharacterized protein n=1 Tax=Ramazzottius varieornatus TaxID=947166 RepID=A0A1D1VDU9_RAMVA|nr:hypothetical protein RvY_10758 [Ramazzottius varieornatus]
MLKSDEGLEDLQDQTQSAARVRRSTRTKPPRQMNAMHHLPAWLTFVLCFIMLPTAFTIQADICNCKNQHFLGLLDSATYTTCEKLAPEPKQVVPIKCWASIYAMKKDAQYFIGTTCKATLQQIETYKSFWGATDTIPSSGPVDLSDADCKRMAQTLSCNGNPMVRLPNSETYAFTRPPSREYSWMATTKNSVWNCLVDLHTVLTQSGPKELIISFFGELGADRNKGYASKNHMTVIWNAIDQSPKKKQCEYQLVANGSGTMYKLEKTRLRLRDPTK